LAAMTTSSIGWSKCEAMPTIESKQQVAIAAGILGRDFAFGHIG